MKTEGMEEARRERILQMAESYLWRGEVSVFQFGIVIDVLEALGWLDEMTSEGIRDDMDGIFPGRRPVKDAPPPPKGEVAL